VKVGKIQAEQASGEDPGPIGAALLGDTDSARDGGTSPLTNRPRIERRRGRSADDQNQVRWGEPRGARAFRRIHKLRSATDSYSMC